MENISNLSQICNVLINSNENVIYGAGYIGKLLYKYIDSKGLRQCVACFAAEKLIDNPTRVDKLPVVEISYLAHMMDSACFFIATQEEKKNEIAQYLQNLGCKNIYGLSEEAVRELELLSQIKESSELSLKNEILYEKEILDRMETRIEYKDEITSLHKRTFSETKNIFQGKKVVILATGPTLEKYEYMNDAIHIGVNTIWKRKDLLLDYFFTQDGSEVLLKAGYSEWEKEVECTSFLGKYLDKKSSILCEYAEKTNYKSKDVRRFFVDFSMNEHIHDDISYHPLMNFGSVVFSALHFALYGRPSQIYLVGCDTNISGHFDSKREISRYDVSKNKIGYAIVKRYIEHRYPETKVYSINPVGLKGLFDEIY